MLVFRRRIGERIWIGDDITIEVVQFKAREVVQIGIVAPPHVPVHREEVYQAIKAGVPQRDVVKR